jgi:hypothetical protein
MNAAKSSLPENPGPDPNRCPPPWRTVAARIVEELFPGTDPETWNLLLDLREHLLADDGWAETLDCFLECRRRLEADNYLPFYRLRKLLAGSLRLEIRLEEERPQVHSHSHCLATVLRTGHRSLADLQRALGRECYEHCLDLPSPDGLRLAVLERA